MTKRQTLIPVILITSLFFLWGFAHNLNPILIPHLKKACQLSDFQSAFVDSAFFIAYFAVALPAGYFMKRFGYKRGIVFGLIIFAFGAFLFFPAADTRAYGLFLAALFVIASGLTFLETAANPYISVLGSPQTAAQRLNFAQSFNGLAATLAPFIGGRYILSGKILDLEEQAAMSANQLNTYLQAEADAVKLPYLVIGATVLLVALLVVRTPLPEINEEASHASDGAGKGKSLWSNVNFVFGVVALFFYVGAQVGVVSFFIRFSDQVAGVQEKAAANLLAIALLGFMVGRFVGTFLMRFIAPAKLLAVFALLNVLFTVLSASVDGLFAVYAMVGVTFLMSIMFPTIFSLAISGLGKHTKQGSSILIMAIVGGAIIPLIMGRVSDRFTMQAAYLVPAACFAVVLLFALRNMNNKRVQQVTIAH
ncbi:L-fucose:H+ symporter permease [Parapedobacter koreensis]|uniref:MFS transporter, FHS family, L-fucose permease n=1 Tax=Parapedobacter koreensis TaxID=332977 RepID=A0A1H7ITN0_9SPHI|nr:L-fucose:H+ symporter permease [Parapedobacter koreensis]SEK64145.1 MFS transporter, FHS family, L-fucose permease [Parapedobacter koreensis]